MSTGSTIKKLRKEAKLTQDQLAALIGISKNGLWNYENDKRNINIDLLHRIAEALDVSINDLIDPITASNELLIESLHKDDNKKELELQKQDLLDKEINKRLSILNTKGKFEAFKRIDDLRFRIEYRHDLGFSTDLPDDGIFDRWMMKENEIKEILEQSPDNPIEDPETK